MLLYLPGPFLSCTLSAKGGRRTISLQVYPFKLIISSRGIAHRVCSNSLLGDSGYLHSPFSGTGSRESGLWGLAIERERQDADPAPGLQL